MTKQPDPRWFGDYTLMEDKTMTDTTEPRAAKGWWTVMWGVGLAAFGGVLPYLAGVDWTQFVNPQWAAFITGMVTILLRGITDTPIGKSK